MFEGSVGLVILIIGVMSSLGILALIFLSYRRLNVMAYLQSNAAEQSGMFDEEPAISEEAIREHGMAVHLSFVDKKGIHVYQVKMLPHTLQSFFADTPMIVLNNEVKAFPSVGSDPSPSQEPVKVGRPDVPLNKEAASLAGQPTVNPSEPPPTRSIPEEELDTVSVDDMADSELNAGEVVDMGERDADYHPSDVSIKTVT